MERPLDWFMRNFPEYASAAIIAALAAIAIGSGGRPALRWVMATGAIPLAMILALNLLLLVFGARRDPVGMLAIYMFWPFVVLGMASILACAAIRKPGSPGMPALAIGHLCLMAATAAAYWATHASRFAAL